MRFPIGLALLLLATSSAAPQETTGQPAGNEACLSCHAEAVKGNPDSPHLRRPASASPVRCEACHGDGSRHVETGGDPQAIRSFKGNPAAAVCAGCHQSPHVAEWKASRHAQVGVDCIDCHAVHTVKDPAQSCKGCH